MKYKERKYFHKDETSIVIRDVEQVEKLIPLLEKTVVRISKAINAIMRPLLKACGEKEEDIIDIDELF